MYYDLSGQPVTTDIEDEPLTHSPFVNPEYSPPTPFELGAFYEKDKRHHNPYLPNTPQHAQFEQGREAYKKRAAQAKA